jgi:2'-5' RNA ligase
MVALYPPEDVAQSLAVDGGEDPSELHLTLCYLGDNTELDPATQGALLEALQTVAANTNPLIGEVSGIGLFSPDTDQDPAPYYASYDSPALVDLRPQVVQAVAGAGVPHIANHGYTPHITLSYVQPGQPVPFQPINKIPCTFDHISFCWGDDRTDIPLGKPANEGSPAMPEMSPMLKEASLGLTALIEKATANVHAKAGETIVGNLARANDGKFTSAGNASAAPIKSAAEVHAALAGGGGKKGKGKGKGKKPAKEKKTPEQKAAESQAKKSGNLSKTADALAGGEYDLIGAAMSELDLPNEVNDANQAVKDDLVKHGLAKQWDDGTYDLTGTGRALVRAGERGDIKGTQRILNTAKHTQQSKSNRKAASAAKLRAKADSISATKEMHLDTSAENTTFTIFKDAQGQARWVLFSSSGFEDKDQQIVTTQALIDDCARADLTKNYGPLLWHHQPELVLGTCDYNAVMNNILVESGTFATPALAIAIERIPASEVGASLGFSARVQDIVKNQFDWIERKERSLLRQHKASNWLTRLFTFRRK